MGTHSCNIEKCNSFVWETRDLLGCAHLCFKNVLAQLGFSAASARGPDTRLLCFVDSLDIQGAAELFRSCASSYHMDLLHRNKSV